MTPEDEEFLEADHILQQAPIPRVSVDAPPDVIQNLTASSTSNAIFYHGDILCAVDLIKIPLTSITLFIQSYGVSSFDMGSGRGVWDGSIIFGSWLCGQFAEQEVQPPIPIDQPVKVLELGSGCSGVPGLCVAHAYQNTVVVFSDAQESLISGLKQNMKLNGYELNNQRVSVQTLNWNNHQQLNFGVQWANLDNQSEDTTMKADVIIGSELLWAGCDPEPLIQTISKTLDRDHGVAYILMPKGGRGVEVSFLETSAALGFKVETIQLGSFESWEGLGLDMTIESSSDIIDRATLSQRDMNKAADTRGVDEFQVHILRFLVDR